MNRLLANLVMGLCTHENIELYLPDIADTNNDTYTVQQDRD
eukprot:SAG11_NODE_363_length_10162_cov_28.285004_10_plen_41_part_00